SEDQLVWNAARTWRLGPEPAYLAAWHSPDFGLGRIDDWERIFRSGGAERHEAVFRRAALIVAAGCYEPLREPLRARDGLYYAEFFRATGSLADVSAHYAERAAHRP